MGLVTALVSFVVGALVGAGGLYAGGRLVTDERSYDRALGTALVGAVVWVLFETVVGWVPLVGPVVTFLAYLTVVNVAYPGDWVEALAVTLVAWATLVAVFVVIGPLTGWFHAVGVPGV